MALSLAVPRRTVIDRPLVGYQYETVSAAAAVDRAVIGTLDIPDFQRGFVWNPAQVRDLAESLWCDYPIGFFLLWEDSESSRATTQPHHWVVDGQQRITSLCILFGQEPHWWPRRSPDNWRRTIDRYDIRFDLEATRPPYFRVADKQVCLADPDRFIALRRLTTLSGDHELDPLIEQIKSRRLCRAVREEELRSRLDSIRRMRDKPLLATTLTHDRDSVFEIFFRLNSRGIRFRRLLLQLLLRKIASRWAGTLQPRNQPPLT